MKKFVSILLILIVLLALIGGSFFIGYTLDKTTPALPEVDLTERIQVDDGEPVYVVGHRNPDLDSVCSAVGFAELMRNMGYDAVPAVGSGICPEAVLLLDRCGKDSPVLLEDATGKTVVLVDHNSPSQGAAGLDAATIAGVFDHHNIQGLSLPSPVFILTEPVGATATIVTGLYDRYGIDMEPGTAVLLLAAILDDTFGLRSSTTTAADESAVRMLQERTGIDTAGLYETICRVKTDYGDMTAAEIMHSHEKSYEMGGHLVSIADIPVMGEEAMEEMLARMEAYLAETEPGTELVHRYVIVSDLGAYSSELIHGDNGEERAVDRAFTADSDGRIVFDEVVSRKAAIVPPLAMAYAALAQTDSATTIPGPRSVV